MLCMVIRSHDCETGFKLWRRAVGVSVTRFVCSTSELRLFVKEQPSDTTVGKGDPRERLKMSY